MEPIVKLDNVSVVYNEGEGIKQVEAIRDISLEIYPKEYVVFFGPSGCGKSTLMNVVAGLEKISGGSVIVAGKNLTELNDEEMAMYHRHEVGFIFQAYNLIPTLSVLENIALPQFFDGVSREEWTKNSMALAERFGIKDQVKRVPAELSGGQQQRVGVARSLINNPALLLADEPTGNLDSKNVRVVLDIFQELNLKEKKTILLVTHSPDYLSEADRIFYLKDGRIIREVYNKSRRINKLDKEGDKEGNKEEKVPPESELLKRLPHPERIEKEARFITEFALHLPEERTIRRIERIIKDHIAGEISGYEMISLLDKPYFEGGAETNRRTAERIGHMVEHILANALILERAEALSDEEIKPTLSYLIASLEAILDLELTRIQEEHLERIIKNRFRNGIGSVKMRRLLHAPTTGDGVGLRPSKAREFQSYIEMLILIANERRAVEEAKRGGEKDRNFPIDDDFSGLAGRDGKDESELGAFFNPKEKKELETETEAGSGVAVEDKN